jgi:REP element-mobilizing transposase RayT
MHAYLGGVSNQLGCPSLVVGGTEDHAHLLIRLSRTISISDLIKEIKRASSHWIKQREPRQHHFAWQAGYGVFSANSYDLEAIRLYIATQQRHHRKLSFQDELRGLLRKHKIEWDERYLWD